MTFDPPDFRAVVRRSTLHVFDWDPMLASGGPLAQLTRSRAKAAVLDLRVVWAEDDDGERVADEVIATPVVGGTLEARVVLTHWAQSVGYRRLWLADEVIALDPRPGGMAAATCTVCRMRWEDAGDPRFWLMARRRGHFPTGCLLCGGPLPQWSVASAVRTADEGATLWG